ncbi:hypothetical protein P1P91_01485 [Halomonas piscis]|uniref:Uncharacterized protein n=1 Tax=Halomonas piscis TaxID=3031727 RepID=A0ABY9YZT9_9GAMM|nr:hypothetical protein [Halomonas piscis]WNK20386.1 hypothetical protein P1P91_01485 [Halomonas piscis]
MSNVGSGYCVKEELMHWQPLCEEWVLLNERFSRVQEGKEKAYSYREVPNVSMLASAAWRCGNVALQEFLINKEGTDTGRGRCDLWIKYPSDDHEEYIEAKFQWQSINPNAPLSRCMATMKKAVADTKKSDVCPSEGGSIALTFLCVYTARKFTERSEKDIAYLVDSFVDGQEDIGWHALAWTFPNEDVEYWKNYAEDEIDLAVGIVMMARRV